MSNVKYLSYDGLQYFWNDKLKPLIEDDEEVIATSLVDLNDRLSTHTHTQYAPTSHTHPAATTTDLGGIKVGTVNATTITKASEGRNYYPVNIDFNGLAYVALPAFTTNTGDITSVTAGNGLTGGATSGAATLNVGAGTGISVAADAVSVDFAPQVVVNNYNSTTHGRIRPNVISYNNVGNNVQWRMMNTSNPTSGDPFYSYKNSTTDGYWDCMLMDCYGGTDVPVVTGIGIRKNLSNSSAWIFAGEKGDSTGTWNVRKLIDETGGSFCGSLTPNETDTYNLGSASLQWNNIYGKTLYENGTSLVNKYAAKSHTHTISDLPTHTYTSAQSLGWTSTLGSTKIPTLNAIAYWNGAWDSNGSSNLAYCSKGAFGTIVTKNAGDYAAASHTHTTVNIGISGTSIYYPLVFTNSTSATTGASLYIDSSTGTSQTSTGIRYNPSANACYCSGGFYEASDERLKNFGDDIEVDLDKLSKLSKKYFTWKDDESNTQHIGVSAQEVQELYPEIVNTIDDEGHLSVSYDKLSVVALKGIDVLNDKIKSLEERLERLEKLIDNK